MDRRRLADVRAGTARESRSSGSGWLIGRRLVLTCRHVVTDDQGDAWPRIRVRIGHPGDGPSHDAAAEVVWVHPDRARDTALLRVEAAPGVTEAAVRWGSPACGDEPFPAA